MKLNINSPAKTHNGDTKKLQRTYRFHSPSPQEFKTEGQIKIQKKIEEEFSKIPFVPK